MTVTLYHHPSSLCSQKVRLALAEKSVAYDARTVDIGPRMENFEPWYVRLNPRMVVPTLEHDGTPVTDSARIVRYIDATFDGPPLHAQEPAERAEEARWLDEADRLPLRELSYGSIGGPIGWLIRRSDRLRLKKLAPHRAVNPELASLYDRNMDDVRRWFESSRDPVKVDALVAQTDALLDGLDARLDGREYLGGARYGVADTLWTVVVARVGMLGYRRLIEAHPHVAAWYARMKARPSFEAAAVQDLPPWRLVLRALFFKGR